jgi:hypothetical protein
LGGPGKGLGKEQEDIHVCHDVYEKQMLIGNPRDLPEIVCGSYEMVYLTVMGSVPGKRGN